jgi:hypothetical protein
MIHSWPISIFHGSCNGDITYVPRNLPLQSWLCWEQTERWFIFSYGRFATNFWYRLQESNNLWLLDRWRLYAALIGCYRRFGPTDQSYRQVSSTASTLKTRPFGCPETSVTTYQSTTPSISEELKSHSTSGRSFELRSWILSDFNINFWNHWVGHWFCEEKVICSRAFNKRDLLFFVEFLCFHCFSVQLRPNSVIQEPPSVKWRWSEVK